MIAIDTLMYPGAGYIKLREFNALAERDVARSRTIRIAPHCTAQRRTLCRTLPNYAMYYTAPHRTTPYYTALHRTTPYYTALHRTIPQRTALHRTAPHYTALHRRAPPPHRTAPHRNATQRNAPHRTALLCTATGFRVLVTTHNRLSPLLVVGVLFHRVVPGRVGFTLVPKPGP